MQEFNLKIQMSEGHAENFENELEDLIGKYIKKGLIGDFMIEWNGKMTWAAGDTFYKREWESRNQQVGYGLTETEYFARYVELFNEYPSKEEVREYISH